MANCRNCGKLFNKTRDWQKFCSNSCRKNYHVSFPLLEKRMDNLERRVEKLMDRIGATINLDGIE